MKKIFLALVCAAAVAAPLLALTGCNQNQNTTGSVGTMVDDKTLQANVQSALANNPNDKFTDVKVAVSGGTVQLSGFVDTQDQKDKAVDLAKAVPGVKDVQNGISLKTARP